MVNNDDHGARRAKSTEHAFASAAMLHIESNVAANVFGSRFSSSRGSFISQQLRFGCFSEHHFKGGNCVLRAPLSDSAQMRSNGFNFNFKESLKFLCLNAPCATKMNKHYKL
jgi:hypothetical protein